MERKEIEEKVRSFLIEDLEIDEEKIAPEAKLKDDLGIDSLDFVDIVVIVENNFGFKIKPEEMQGADAGFFCGTAAEIVALDSLDNIPFKMNWEDSLSAKIQTAYRHLVLEEDYSYLKSNLQYV